MGCNKCTQSSCSCTSEVCTTPIRYQGPDIECVGVSQGESVDTVLRKMSEFICDNISLKGDDGADGVGIDETIDNGNGTFTFNFTDGTSFTTSDLTGPEGQIGTVRLELTTATDFNTSTVIGIYSQNGRHLIIDNGVNNINITVDIGVTASYQVLGTGTVTFLQGVGRTLQAPSGASLTSQYSTATLTFSGTTDILLVNNV